MLRLGPDVTGVIWSCRLHAAYGLHEEAKHTSNNACTRYISQRPSCNALAMHPTAGSGC